MCKAYERNEEVYIEGEMQCCQNCRYNNDTSDNCLLGDDYPMEDED